MTADHASAADLAAVAALERALPYAEDWLAYRAWFQRIPGIQYAVSFDGRVRLSGAWGLADLESRTPLTTSHLFRIASHSKTFTGTAILQLVEDGRVRLDAPVADYVPELADAPSGIGRVTVRAMLENGGGVIRDGLDGDFWQHAHPFPDEAELLAMVRDHGVKFVQDASFNYSNIGFSLLGVVIARASGQSYHDYVRARIIEPLGLTRTFPDYHLAPAGEHASAHTGLATSRERWRIPHVDTGGMSSATGFTSTAEDLVRYISAHRVGSGELLSDASKNAQQRTLWTDADGTSYGLGMMVEEFAGRRIIGHGGGYPGHITRTCLDTTDGIAVSVLTNAVDGPAEQLAHGVIRILDAALARPERRLRPSAPLPDDTSRFEGRFASFFSVTDIVRLGDRLLALDPTGADPLHGPTELEVVDDGALRPTAGSGYYSVGETYPYQFDADGRAVSMRGASRMTMWRFDPEADFTPPYPTAY
jgi:CubicO group peptidase (beta-lactamase class C family)